MPCAPIVTSISSCPPAGSWGCSARTAPGKTTLMNVLFGMVHPDAGRITFKERPFRPRSPRDAIAAGIGMIHQHFMLVAAMSVTDNVMLGWEGAGAWLRTRAVAQHVAAASETLPGSPSIHRPSWAASPWGSSSAWRSSRPSCAGRKPADPRRADVQPHPPEVSGLLGILQRLRAEGKSVVFISHGRWPMPAARPRVRSPSGWWASSPRPRRHRPGASAAAATP